MAQKIQVVLIDDIDGGPADETLTFAVDGTWYEIDLSSANAAKFRDALGPFVGNARKTTKGGRRPARPSNRTDRSAQIRAWARSQGIIVNERGRVPTEIAAQFDAAHPAESTGAESPGAESVPAAPDPTGSSHPQAGDPGDALKSPFR